MRLTLIIFPLLFLLVPPGAADWERLHPATEPPAVIIPKSDAECRADARRIDDQLRRARDLAKHQGTEAGLRIVQAGEAERQRFAEECIRPQGCPAFAQTTRDVNRSGQPATDAYALMRELCGRQDGQK